MSDMDQSRLDEARFIQLLAMFQMAGMQQLGKVSNPVSGEVSRDLDQAQATIGMLETIEKRTEGNRTPGETEFLEKVLFELRMNYVDETRREGAESSDSADESADSGEPEQSGADEPEGSGEDPE